MVFQSFFCIQLFPVFFIVQVFQSPDFSQSRFFRVQVFQGLGFSESRFFRVQVLEVPGFSGSRSRVWVQVLEVALCQSLVIIKVAWKKRLQHSCFPVNFAKRLKALFYRTTPSDCLCKSWREFVRDVLTWFLMTVLEEF